MFLYVEPNIGVLFLEIKTTAQQVEWYGSGGDGAESRRNRLNREDEEVLQAVITFVIGESDEP